MRVLSILKPGFLIVVLLREGKYILGFGGELSLLGVGNFKLRLREKLVSFFEIYYAWFEFSVL